MKLISALAIVMVFLGTSCNFVSQAEFDEHVIVANETTENIRLCDQYRGVYHRRAQTCLHGLFVDDYGEVARRLIANGIERGTEKFEEEHGRYARDLREGYCNWSCLYETTCYEPGARACDFIRSVQALE